MFRKLLTNKRILIVLSAVILVLIAGTLILVTSDFKENDRKNTDSKTEQSTEDIDSKKDEDGNGLNVLEPDEIDPEDSTNASGSWKNTSNFDAQSGNNDKTEKDNQTESKNPSEDKEDDSENVDKQDDVLEDDISWGNIY